MNQIRKILNYCIHLLSLNMYFILFGKSSLIKNLLNIYLIKVDERDKILHGNAKNHQIGKTSPILVTLHSFSEYRIQSGDSGNTAVTFRVSHSVVRACASRTEETLVSCSKSLLDQIPLYIRIFLSEKWS